MGQAGYIAPAPSYACENPQARSFKLNPLNSLSCRKMTIQRLKNLRLMTQRYLVLAVVGWLDATRRCNIVAQFLCLGQVGPLTHCANALCNHVYIFWNETSFLKKEGHSGMCKCRGSLDF